MGGVSKALKNVTKAVTSPFKSIAKGALGAVGLKSPTVEKESSSTATPTPAAADVSVANTTPQTQTGDTTKRGGLLRSAKGKKSLTVSRASGGGLNV